MRKSLTFFDVIRFVFSLCIFVILFLLSEEYFLSGMQADEATLGFLVKRYFLVEGLGSFISLFLSLLVVSRRYKVVVGTLFMFGALLGYLISIVLTNLTNFMTFGIGIVGLSFISVGTCSAILIWMFINSKIKPNINKKVISLAKKSFPQTSKILMFLALISVPVTYITMIISAFITLGLSLWVLGIVLQFPRIPIVILVAIGVAPLVSLWAAFSAIKAIFFVKPEFQTAVKLNLSDKPNLKKVIAEVCNVLKTKFPDVVILHVQPTFFVTESKFNSFDGIIKGRTLAMGAPLIRQLQLNELRVILAHEFAHFSGNDTLYSRFVVPVYQSINSAMSEMAGVGNNKEWGDVGGLLSLILIVPLSFLRIFLTYFATIDKILSRSRELRADWIASSNFGSLSMSSGLTKVVQIAHHYNEEENKIGFENNNYFDSYNGLLTNDLNKLDDYKEKALAEIEQEFDSHPTLSTRLASLPDSTKDNMFDDNIESIRRELKDDEQRLSTSYQGLIKNYLENKERSEKANREFELLNEAQMSVIQVLFQSLKVKHKLIDDDMKFLSAYLILGEEIVNPDIMKRLERVIFSIKTNSNAWSVIKIGAAVRVGLLNQYELKADSNKILVRFQSFGINLNDLSQQDLPTLEEYANTVKLFCDGQQKAS